MAKRNEPEEIHERGLALETAKPEVTRPPLYSVMVLNDDFTPMDFFFSLLIDKKRLRSCCMCIPAGEAFAACSRAMWLNQR
jgi:hypothetical protein